MSYFRSVLRDLSQRRDEVRRLMLVTFYLATVLALTASGTPYLSNVMVGKPDAAASFWADLLWMSIWLYAWLLIVPVIYGLAIRVNAERGDVRRIFAVYLGGFAFAYVVHVGIQISAMLLPPYQDVHSGIAEAVIHHMLSGVYLLAITYGGVAASCHAIAGHRLEQEMEMRQVRVESDRVQARMHALRSQLQPHFLFNALNSVSTLMYKDVTAADEMLAGIGDLLRVLIKDSDRHLVTLREEIEFVETYLSVESIRHGENLHVSMDCDVELDDALVPTLVLQPIVENAIKHGISKITGAGRIHISAAAADDTLTLRVSDNGPGFSSGDGANETGVGLSNLKARLKEMYGADQSLSVLSSAGEATVEIRIPLQMTLNPKDVEAPVSK